MEIYEQLKEKILNKCTDGLEVQPQLRYRFSQVHTFNEDSSFYVTTKLQALLITQPLSLVTWYTSVALNQVLKCLSPQIRLIEEKGRGVFSTRHFNRKEFIVEYSGTLISYEEAKRREAEYVKEPEKYGCYMYYFVFKNKKYW